MTCKFEFSEGVFCSRKARGDYCRFHTPLESNNRISDTRYHRSLNALLRKGDGDFRGFIFPRSLDVKNYDFKENINLAGATFENVYLYKTDFGTHVSAVDCKFNGEVNVRECLFDNLSVSSSVFSENVNLMGLETKSRFDSDYCVFKSNFIIHGKLRGIASFSYSYFHSKTVFSWFRAEHFKSSIGSANTICSGSLMTFQAGQNEQNWLIKNLKKIEIFGKKVWSNFKKKRAIFRRKAVVMGRKLNAFLKAKWHNARKRFPYEKEGLTEIPLFCGNAYLVNVVFEKPKLVSFINVDLSNANFDTTDLRGVSFLNCYWYQKPLNRNGLVQEHKYDLDDYHSRRYWLPRIESVGRNIRQALEDNRDFNLANDFFISEMEAKRQQLNLLKRHFFSILAWYHALSNYGTSPLTCLKFIFLLSCLHASILLEYVGFNFNPLFELIARPTTLPTMDELHSSFTSLSSSLLKPFVHSLQIMTLQRNKIISDLQFPYWVDVVNFIASITGPVLTILFGLCVRTKIKRS